MTPNHLDQLHPEQAQELLAKTRFWRLAMWNSLASGILFLVLAFGSYVFHMMRAFDTLRQTGHADPSAIADHISKNIIFTIILIPLAALSFLIFLISFIRLLSLPKLPK